jgi:hypothetical protein
MLRRQFKLKTIFVVVTLAAICCAALSRLPNELSEEARCAVIGLIVLPAATFFGGLALWAIISLLANSFGRLGRLVIRR